MSVGFAIKLWFTNMALLNFDLGSVTREMGCREWGWDSDVCVFSPNGLDDLMLSFVSEYAWSEIWCIGSVRYDRI